MNDALHGGPGGGPKTDATGQPYSYLTAHRDWQQQGQEVKTPPLGASQVGQLNTALTDRYQVLNPGKPLPAEFTLPANATQKDYDRIDKGLESVEKAQGTKAQQQTANALREQAAALAQQNQQDRQDKEGMTWVSWQDKDGRTVAGPMSMAKAAGAKDYAQVPTEEVRNITDARQVVNMVDKKGDAKGDPSTWGVLQLADSLNKDNKMGAFVSRYNRLMTQGVGAEPNDDPRIIALLDKGQLMTTLTMKAHFGAGGGRSPQMLDHFLQLADAGKMDAPTFMGGTRTILDYMNDRAELPNQGNAAAGGGTQKKGSFKEF
jgi:hypothetical protein